MVRLALLLLLAVPVLAKGTRSDYVAARDALADAYFDELDPAKRDELFRKLASWDHPEIIPDLALIASRFGTYLDGIEGERAAAQKKLEAYSGRQALTDQEIGLRNHYIRKIEKLEKAWSRARKSEDLLVDVVGGFAEKETILGLLAQWERHPTWRVRQILARACAHWHVHAMDTALSKKLFKVLKRLRTDKETGVRVAVARALVAFRRQEAFDLLKLCLRDADWRVRAATVAGLKLVRTPEVVSLLIEQMGREKGRLKDDINNALRRLTGENHGYADAWARWWASVGGKLPDKRADVNRGGGAGSDPKAKDTAQFYGIPTRSKRICFVIDISGSMKKEVEQIRRVVITGRPATEQPVEGKTRLEVAKNELKRAISNMSPKREFNIIFFNHAAKVWRETMTKANPTGKREARKDVEAVVASGTTYTLGALREAFRIAGAFRAPGDRKKDEPGIDTIFVLSDGGPTDNKIEEPKPMDPELILDSVREWNRDIGVVIHTIAVDTEEVGTYFLKQLATQNGGVFVERKK